MAPAHPFDKIKKAARNSQRALGGGWKDPFPDMANQHSKDVPALTDQKSKVVKTKIIKSTAKCTRFFMSNEELLADIKREREEKLAQEKLAQRACKDKGSDRASDLVTTAESSNKGKARADSLSPLSSAPTKKPALKRSSSGLSFECSSSSATTSVRGVHLLLAIIPEAHYDRWCADFEDLCNLTGNNINAYYSSIETATDLAGLKIYADCENKLMGDMLKKKLQGDIVLNKELICQFI
ncbi:hypothetical protein KCU65_g7487, partial [Aureobasidium melanogenum]